MRRLLPLALLLAACSSSPVSPGHDAGAGGEGGAGTQSFSFHPAALPAGAEDLTNTMRGQYLWLGVDAYPAGWADVDSYQRWSWADLEPTHGNYAWHLVDEQIAAAKARHGRFGFRVMPLCQGCAHHTYLGAKTSLPDDLADAVDPLIGAAPGESDPYLLPDWNSEAYLGRLEELLQAIGDRYRDEPTLAWMDVSAYGNWGEFHLYPFNRPGGPYDGSKQRPITDDNARRVVKMNAAAFPGKLLVINSEQPAALAEAVQTASPPIGLRVDCLGSDGLAGGEQAIMAAPGASERWRTAPFITEWCQYNLGDSGADLFVQGEQQVRDFHVSMLSSGNFSADPTPGTEADAYRKANVEAGYRLRLADLGLTLDPARPGKLAVRATWVNENVAPTYLAWKVSLTLTGPATVKAALGVDLRRVMPDAAFVEEEEAEVSALPAGDYQVAIAIEDAQAISAPMALAMEGRSSDGSHALGSITVR